MNDYQTYVDAAEALLRSVRGGSPLDRLIREAVRVTRDRASCDSEAEAVPLLAEFAGYSLRTTENEVARLDALLDSVWTRAAKTGRKSELVLLSRRLLDKSNTRTAASALAEVAVLGIFTQQWGDAVELWPFVGADTESRSECQVRLPEVTLNVEVGASWVGPQRRVLTRPLAPRGVSGRPYRRDDVPWQRLHSQLKEKRRQFGTRFFNLFFWNPYILHDERNHGWLGPRKHGLFDSALSEFLRGKAWTNVQLQVVELDPDWWLKRTYACHRHGYEQLLQSRVAAEVRAAFEQHWFVRSGYDVRGISV
jgi:hypothetical protein